MLLVIMLNAESLHKTYKGDGAEYQALRGVDLSIGRGECISIIGKSGSGKSTLMHLLACLDSPTSGKIYVDGKDVSTLTEKAKNVLRNENFGFVFQQFFLNGRDTVLDNVALPLRIRGVSNSQINPVALEALAAVGMDDKANKQAKDLSGGEKQRVGIARALINQPQVIFADAPMSAWWPREPT